MTNTVPEPTDTSAPTLSRRQVLTFLALADVPMPELIYFHDEYPDACDIDPGDNRDLMPLMALFGAADQEIRRQRYDHEEHSKHGFILKVEIRWRGWSISIRGFADDGVTQPCDSLDEAIRDELKALVAEAVLQS
jgi:hypothetical protein